MGEREPSYVAILRSRSLLLGPKLLDSLLFLILGKKCVFLYDSDEESGDKGDTDDKQSGLPSLSGEQNTSSGGKSSKRGKRRVRALDDSDEDDTGLDNVLQNGDKSGESEDDEGGNKENTETAKKATTSDSDDDDDDLEYSRNISDTEDVNNNADKSQSEAGKKRLRDDNDDESSDDDEEFNLPLNFHKKARRVLVDEDDDD